MRVSGGGGYDAGAAAAAAEAAAQRAAEEAARRAAEEAARRAAEAAARRAAEAQAEQARQAAALQQEVEARAQAAPGDPATAQAQQAQAQTGADVAEPTAAELQAQMRAEAERYAGAQLGLIAAEATHGARPDAEAPAALLDARAEVAAVEGRPGQAQDLREQADVQRVREEVLASTARMFEEARLEPVAEKEEGRFGFLEDAGGAIRDAAGDVGGAARDVAGDAAGKAARKAGDVVGGALDTAGDVAGAARDVTGKAAGAAKDGVVAGAKATWDGTRWVGGKVADGAVYAGGKVKDGALYVGGKAVDLAQFAWGAGKELKAGIEKVIDPRPEIERLGDGDELKIALGAEVDFEVTARVEGELSIAREDEGGKPTYAVTVTGTAAVGLIGQLGAKAGSAGGAQGKAEGELAAKASYTMRFDSAEDAAKAAQTVQMLAVSGGLQGQVPPVGLALAQAVRPGADELAHLAAHRESVTVSGALAVSVAGQLGVGKGGLLEQAGVEGAAGLAVESSAKITFPKGDEPATVTLTDAATLSGSASGGIPGAPIELAGSGAVGVSVARTYEVPGIDRGALLDRPFETLGGAFDKAKASEVDEVTLTGSLEGEGAISFADKIPLGASTDAAGKVVEDRFAQTLSAGGKVGAEASIAFRSRPGDAKAAIQAALRDRSLGSALASLEGSGVRVKAEADLAVYHGIDLNEELTIMGVGGALHAQYERRDAVASTSFEGSPREALASLEALGRKAGGRVVEAAGDALAPGRGAGPAPLPGLAPLGGGLRAG